MEFKVGDYMFLKVSPKKRIMQFGKKGKLAPWYTGPFEIIRVMGKTAYKLNFPAQLSRVHDVFHVSMLRKCEPNHSHVGNLEGIENQDGVTYEEQLVRIIDTKEKVLRNKVVSWVKVLGQDDGME